MKNLFLIIALLSFIASISMYIIGDGSSHLSELKDLFFIPLPLGVVSMIIFFVKSSKKETN